MIFKRKKTIKYGIKLKRMDRNINKNYLRNNNVQIFDTNVFKNEVFQVKIDHAHFHGERQYILN